MWLDGEGAIPMSEEEEAEELYRWRGFVFLWAVVTYTIE